MSDRSTTFVKGGCGCILVFFGLGLLALLVGGRVRIGPLGLTLLFAIGGAGALLIAALTRKAAPPPGPRPWTCVACGSDNEPGATACRNCRDPR